jgi:superfamily II DNA/RNA helicase
MSFEALGLHAALISALTDAGYTEPTSVQQRAIPAALAGADLMVSSSTGSGKTAAFLLPALHRLIETMPELLTMAKAPRPFFKGRPGPGPRPRFDATRPPPVKEAHRAPQVLVLAPTRELAAQVERAARAYGRHVPGLRSGTVLGGMPYPAQLAMLRGALDVLIATPGRLIDHLESGKLDLSQVRTLVLDEADRMLDLGFIDDIRAIAAATPADRQTVMFSATFAGHVSTLAKELMKPEVQRIDVANAKTQHADITQRLHWADHPRHKDALLDHLLADAAIDQAIIFAATQLQAEELAARLYDAGHAVAPLHGGMKQGLRNRTLMALRRREVRVLVATDVAARGIDVPTISHVINYGLPMNAEDYVHRIGRTGRAGRSGLAITLADHRDGMKIRRIEQFTSQRIPESEIPGLEPQQRPRQAPPSGRRDARGRPGHHRDGGRRDSPFGAPRGAGPGPRHAGQGPRSSQGPRQDGPRDAHRPPRRG